MFPGGRLVARYNVYRACRAQATLLQHERYVRPLPYRTERLSHLTGNYHQYIAIII